MPHGFIDEVSLCCGSRGTSNFADLALQVGCCTKAACLSTTARPRIAHFGHRGQDRQQDGRHDCKSRVSAASMLPSLQLSRLWPLCWLLLIR